MTVRNVRPTPHRRLAALLVYYAVQCVVLGAYGWYMAHVVGRIGIRLGLGTLPNIVVTFGVVLGSAVAVQRLLDKYAFGRFLNGEGNSPNSD